VKCPGLFIYGLKSVRGGNRLREIIEIEGGKNQRLTEFAPLFTRFPLPEAGESGILIRISQEFIIPLTPWPAARLQDHDKETYGV
jgi:hypothetical protein